MSNKDVQTIQNIARRFANFWHTVADTTYTEEMRGLFLIASRQFWIIYDKLEDLKEEEADA